MFFERIFGFKVYRRLPRGIDPLSDLAHLVPDWRPGRIFDVGAKTGRLTTQYAKRYPEAAISSFEPVAETFHKLEKAVSGFPKVECFQLAFAAQAGEGIVVPGRTSGTNRILPASTGGIPPAAERVTMETVEGFCAARGIQSIHYLKVDTEGADMDVLRGSEPMLRSTSIDVVEVEAGIGLDNELHVPLQTFRDYLEPYGYQVFGFYEQKHEWKKRLPHLRRTNIVFISPRVEGKGTSRG